MNSYAAAKESSIYLLAIALMVIFVLSDCFRVFPPIWHLLAVIIITACLIGVCFYYAKALHKSKKDKT